jgi:multidrug efflux pump subunit AcrB
MPEGTPVDTTERAIQQNKRAAYQLRDEMDAGQAVGEPSLFGHVMSSIGAKFDKSSVPVEGGLGSHVAEVAVELNLPADYDGITPGQFAARWRELTGPVPDAVEISFDASAFDAGEDINIQFRGDDLEQLKQAASLLRQDLASYPGVHDISDTFRAGKQEMRLGLLPEARNLGLSSSDLARQVRQAFYGEEVQRVQRGREDIKVMVRYPEAQRRSLGDLEDMRIRTGEGAEVPFASVASVELGAGYSDISRVDGKRVISVIAKIDRSETSPEKVRLGIDQTSLPAISARFPELSYAQAGEAEESADSMAELVSGAVLAAIVIYALLAIPLQSYAQPLIIMSVIPFGAMGAIFGHYLMGWDLVFFSLLGIVALAGVVINASLVMVDYINRQRREGVALRQAILISGRARFRPIVLTSTTTFVGLLPLISMTSLATGVFVPMAISLAFGVLFSTLITLFLVPCFYLIQDDIKGRLHMRRQQIKQSVKRAWKQEGWPG